MLQHSIETQSLHWFSVGTGSKGILITYNECANVTIERIQQNQSNDACPLANVLASVQVQLQLCST